MGVGPEVLGDDHVLDQPGRGQGQERQHRDGQAGRGPRGEQAETARPAQQKEPDHGQRYHGPELDGHGEAERRAAPGQPAGTVGQPVAIEHREGAEQAEQVQPRLEHERVRGGQGVRVHGVDPAGDRRGHRAAVPDEQAEQDYAGRVGGRGDDPRDGQAPRGAGPLGQERDRRHQHGGARRLHRDEVPVRDHAADQAQRVAEIHGVVVLGQPEQVARPGQLVEAQERAGGGAHGDHRVHQPGRLDPAQRNAGLGCAGHADAVASSHRFTFRNRTASTHYSPHRGRAFRLGAGTGSSVKRGPGRLTTVRSG